VALTIVQGKNEISRREENDNGYENAPGGIEKVQPGKNEISRREENDNGMKTQGKNEISHREKNDNGMKTYLVQIENSAGEE